MSVSRILSLTLAAALVAPVAAWHTPAAHAATTASGPSVEVNGTLLPDAGAFLENGSTYVPLRAVSTALGAEVRWSPEGQAAEASLGNDRIHLFLGTPVATINGQITRLAAPPKVVAGRTYVPLRFMAEAFGAKVGWNGELQRVSITTPQPTPPVETTAVASRPKLMILPVYTYNDPIRMEQDPIFKSQRPWQVIYLQQKLEQELGKVAAFEVVPVAKLKPLLDAGFSGQDKAVDGDRLNQYRQFINGTDRYGFDQLPKAAVSRALGVDCFLTVKLDLNPWGRTQDWMAGAETRLDCSANDWQASPDEQVELPEGKPLPHALDALAATWRTAYAEASLPATITEMYEWKLDTNLQDAADYVYQGELEKAAQKLDAVKAHGQANAEWLTLRGDLYLREAKKAEGIALLKRATALAEEPDHQHWLLARAHLSDRNLAGAVPLLQYLHSTPRADLAGDARTALARIYFAQGKDKEAAEVTAALLSDKLGVVTPDALYTAYRVYSKLGDKARAEEALQGLLEAARSSANDAATRLVLFRTILLAGYVSDAGLYLEIGQAYEGVQDGAGAEAAYRKAIALAPGWEPPYRELRSLLHGADRHAEIVDLYAQAAARAGGDATWLGHFRYGQGISLMYLGRTSEAIAAMHAAAEADPHKYEKVENAIAYIEQRQAAASAGAVEMSLSEVSASYGAHQGTVIQVEGKIRGALDAYTFQLGTGWNTVMVRTAAPLQFRAGDYVSVTGTVSGSFSGYNAFGMPLTLGQIVDAVVQDSGFLDVELTF